MPSMAEVSVSTVTATATSTGYHMLKLEGYKRLKGMHGNGNYIESCRFQAAGHTWKIRCYPNGYRVEDKAFLSLYLVRDDDGAAATTIAHAEVELALDYTKLLPMPSFPGRFTQNFGVGESHGFRRFISTEQLGFLWGDCLDIRCKITAVEKSAVEGVVKAADMKRMGVEICRCNDDLCKRHHLRWSASKGRLKKALLKFWRSIVQG